MSSSRRPTERRQVRRLACCVPLLLCLLSEAASCGVVNNPPVQLKLVSVDVLKQSEIPEIQKWWDSKSIATPLFRVVVSSDVDLQKLAKKNYSVDNRTSICRSNGIDAKRLLKGFPSVVDQHGMIYTYRSKFALSSGAGRSSPETIRYSVFFDPSQSGIYGFTDYDLAKNPDDICIEVRGAEQSVPVGFTSNTVVVPKRAITEALIRAGLRR